MGVLCLIYNSEKFQIKFILFDFSGPCTGKFDMVFDLVRSRPGTKNSRIFNSYFFRDDHYWMYENNNQRARFGDPLLVTPEWGGLPNNLDAFLHYWQFSLNTLTFTDEYYFFKGLYTLLLSDAWWGSSCIIIRPCGSPLTHATSCLYL